MATNSMKYTSPSFTGWCSHQLACPERIRHTYLDQCMFEISVGEQRVTGISVVGCSNERKQRIQVNISLPGAARTVVLRQFDALFQWRTTDKGEINHDGAELPNIHIFRQRSTNNKSWTCSCIFSHFHVWCIFTFSWQESWLLIAFKCDCSEGEAQPYKSFHSYITMETTNPPPALFVYFFHWFKKKVKYSSSLSSSRFCQDHRRTNTFYLLQHEPFLPWEPSLRNLPHLSTQLGNLPPRMLPPLLSVRTLQTQSGILS